MTVVCARVSREVKTPAGLGHTAVVRKLTPLGSIDSLKSVSFSAQPVVQVAKTWKRDNLKAVVFVQERVSRRVLGAASVSLGS